MFNKNARGWARSTVRQLEQEAELANDSDVKDGDGEEATAVDGEEALLEYTNFAKEKNAMADLMADLTSDLMSKLKAGFATDGDGNDISGLDDSRDFAFDSLPDGYLERAVGNEEIQQVLQEGLSDDQSHKQVKKLTAKVSELEKLFETKFSQQEKLVKTKFSRQEKLVKKQSKLLQTQTMLLEEHTKLLKEQAKQGEEHTKLLKEQAKQGEKQTKQDEKVEKLLKCFSRVSPTTITLFPSSESNGCSESSSDSSDGATSSSDGASSNSSDGVSSNSSGSIPTEAQRRAYLAEKSLGRVQGDKHAREQGFKRVNKDLDEDHESTEEVHEEDAEVTTVAESTQNA
jgi:hypothetical protein